MRSTKPHGNGQKFAAAAKLQVEAADVVLLTKSDLAESPAVVDAAEAACRALLPHPRTPVIRVNHGEIPISLVTGITPEGDVGPATSGRNQLEEARVHLRQDGVEVMIYRAARAFDPVAFERYIQERKKAKPSLPGRPSPDPNPLLDSGGSPEQRDSRERADLATGDSLATLWRKITAAGPHR